MCIIRNPNFEGYLNGVLLYGLALLPIGYLSMNAIYKKHEQKDNL